MITPSRKAGANHVVVYVSRDGGKTWRPTLNTDGSAFSGFDPACAYSRDGSAVLATFLIHKDESGLTQDLNIYGSPDGGDTWTTKTTAGNSLGFDRPYVVVDNTDGEFSDRIYVSGNIPELEGLYGPQSIGNLHFYALYRSTDRGVTFSENTRLPFPGSANGFLTGNVIILSDGTVGSVVTTTESVVDDEKPNYRLGFVSSDDGGITMGPATEIYTGSGGSLLASLAVDSGSSHFKDRIYAAWEEFTLRLGKQERAVMLAYSSDKGKSWSQPIVVNQSANSAMPTLAVNRAGVVGLVWYETGGPGNHDPHTRLVFAASLDGGETFLPAVDVFERPRKMQKFEVLHGGRAVTYRLPNEAGLAGTVNVAIYNTFSIGHTVGLAADANGDFHPLWIDARTGVPQAWTTVISVDGSVLPFGIPTQVMLGDVSNVLDLSVINTRYDFDNSAITGDAILTNNDSSIIRGRVVARIVSMRSGLGELKVANSDNGLSSPGATWDFTSLIPEQGLNAGESTLVKPIRIEVEEWGGRVLGEPLLELRLQILGEADSSTETNE